VKLLETSKFDHQIFPIDDLIGLFITLHRLV